MDTKQVNKNYYSIVIRRVLGWQWNKYIFLKGWDSTPAAIISHQVEATYTACRDGYVGVALCSVSNLVHILALHCHLITAKFVLPMKCDL